MKSPAAAGVYVGSKHEQIQQQIAECMVEPDPAPVLVLPVRQMTAETRRRAA